MHKKKFNEKKLYFILFIVFGFCQLFLISCTNLAKNLAGENLDISDSNENAGKNGQKFGYLSLSIVHNSESNAACSRAVMSLDEVNSVVSLYELLIFNDSEYKKISFKTDDSKIEVPTGTWRVICLAGTKKLLVGSGYVENVIIEENEITTIVMNMHSIDVSMVCDKEEVYCGETYKVSASVNTKNPYLIPSSVYANSKKINLVCDDENNLAGKGEMEYTAGAEEETLSIAYSTSLVYFKTENFEYKLSECSDFEGIYNYTVIDKEGVTGVRINILEKIISTGIGLSVCWVD